MPSQNRHRILIVDDHPMMREGLRTLISRERDLIVCGEAETAGQALDAVAKLKPDLVLADITLPGPNGIELIKDICALQQGMLILVISMHDESLYAERVLRAGARGYIMKQESGPTMMQAIRQVLAKRIYLSDKMSARILGSRRRMRGDGRTPDPDGHRKFPEVRIRKRPNCQSSKIEARIELLCTFPQKCSLAAGVRLPHSMS